MIYKWKKNLILALDRLQGTIQVFEEILAIMTPCCDFGLLTVYDQIKFVSLNGLLPLVHVLPATYMF